MSSKHKSKPAFMRMILAICVLGTLAPVFADDASGDRIPRSRRAAAEAAAAQQKSNAAANSDDDEIEDLKRRLREAEAKKLEKEKEQEKAEKAEKENAKKDRSEKIDLSASVLIVTSASGTGTGFVGEFKGKYFIVTNAHMMKDDTDLTFTTMSGRPLSFSNVGYTGDSRDIFMIQLISLPPDVVALPMSENVVLDAAVDDEIMVCGNPLGGGVLHNTHGTLMAIGPGIIELDCPVFVGNSGSPIYHKKSKKVIGVVSHGELTSRGGAYTKNAKQMKGSPIKRATRFFGVRADSVQNWSPISPMQIGVQYKELGAYARKLEYLDYLKAKDFTALPDVGTYPELEKIVYKYWNAKKRGLNSKETVDKKATRDLFDDVSRLMTHEMARLRSVKVCDFLQPSKAWISENFSKARDAYASLASAAFKQ